MPNKIMSIINIFSADTILALYNQV